MNKRIYKAILLSQIIRNVIVLIVLMVLIIFVFIRNTDGAFASSLKSLLVILLAHMIVQFEKIEVYQDKIVHFKSYMFGVFSKKSIFEFQSVKSISIVIDSITKEKTKNSFLVDLNEYKKWWNFPRENGLYAIEITWPNLQKTEIPTVINKKSLDMVIEKMQEESDYKTLIDSNNKN